MKLSSAYRSFATDTEKDGITKSLQEIEDWLYDDDESDERVYTGKLDDLKKVVGGDDLMQQRGHALATAPPCRWVVNIEISTQRLVIPSSQWFSNVGCGGSGWYIHVMSPSSGETSSSVGLNIAESDGAGCSPPSSLLPRPPSPSSSSSSSSG
ncbi:heat shock protein 70 family protein [Tanacetum coccineum]